ncbi:MAG: hypothetical protein K8R48_04705 [Alphaproteobacteria bacterium]|nr:hypothetical protein [Alphaproteobacteria bacterium]
MRKQSTLKKLLLILLFAAFLNAGYWSVSKATQTPLVVTPSAACNAPCIAGTIVGGTFMGGISGTGASIVASIAATIPVITAQFTVSSADFSKTILKKINDTKKNITDGIETLWTKNLSRAMQDQSSQLTAINASQSYDISVFFEAANLVRALRENQLQQIKSLFEQSVGEGGCVTATVTGGMTRASTIRRAYNAAAPAAQVGRSGNSTEDPNSVSPAADMKARWDNYTTRYCEKDYNNGASGCTSDQTFAGEDIDVAGTIFGKETIDLKVPDVKQTVDDLIVNIAEPFIKSAVPPGAVESAPGEAAILAGEAYKAKRQVIYDSLYHIVSRRAPGSAMKEFVAPLREDAGIAPEMISDNPSPNEVMQVMMSERFRSSKNAAGQVDEPENNQREMVIQQAFQLMQMSDQLDLMDRYSLLLAAQAGAEVRKAKHLGSAVGGATMKQ